MHNSVEWPLIVGQLTSATNRIIQAAGVVTHCRHIFITQSIRWWYSVYVAMECRRL